MRKFYLVAVLTLVSLGATAQKTKIESFTTLDVFGPFDIELIKSDENAIDIDYAGISRDDVIQDVHRGVLKLKLKNRHYVNEWSSSHRDYRRSRVVRVKVYYVDIDAMELEAGARITSRESFKSKNLEINANMGAELDLDILAKNVYIRSSMGAIVDLTGRAENLEIKASMGSELRLSRLETKVSLVKATMGANVVVNASDELDVSAGFGAVVNYTGGPAVRYTNSSMGAEIRRRGN
jgi:hypothetical protein